MSQTRDDTAGAFRGGMPAAFLRSGSSSFADFAEQVAPNVLPGSRTPSGSAGELTPHATTLIAATFDDGSGRPAGKGVVMAGDRRATMGNMIAQRDIEKVFGADELSMIGIAGAAGIGIEMNGLF